MPRCAACCPPLACYPPLDRAQLVRAGHEVRIFVAPDYLSLVPKLEGLSVHCRTYTTAAFMEELAPLIAIGKMDDIIKAEFEGQAKVFAQDADALKAICESWAEIAMFNALAGHTGLAVTEALNMKALLLHVQPLIPTRELFILAKVPKCTRMFLWWLVYSKLV